MRRGARASLVRVAGPVALLVGLALLGRALPVGRALAAVEGMVAEAGPWGPLLYGVAYVLAALLLVPGSALTLGAGALFGPLLGTVVVSLASTCGAGLAFLLGRHAARAAVEAAARRRPVFSAIDRAVSEGGWRTVALLRLSPLVPYSLGNYLFGLTGVRFWPYLLASWATMLPGTLVGVLVGHAGRTGLSALASGASPSAAEWALLAAGLLATVAASVWLGRRARAALQAREQGIKDRRPPATPARPRGGLAPGC